MKSSFYKKKYNSYKEDYIKLKRIISEESPNAIIKPTNYQLEYIFPFLNNKSKLLITKIGAYSATGVAGAKFIINVIKRHSDADIGKMVITDGTGNIGSDTIMFGLTFNKVNSIELESINYQALTNNIKEYKLENTVNLYHDDTIKRLTKLQQDIIYIDAPWGGPSYKENKNMLLYLSNLELSDIYIKFMDKAKLFVFKVPRNYNVNYLVEKITGANKNISIHIYTYFRNEKALFNLIIIDKKNVEL